MFLRIYIFGGIGFQMTGVVRELQCFRFVSNKYADGGDLWSIL